MCQAEVQKRSLRKGLNTKWVKYPKLHEKGQMEKTGGSFDRGPIGPQSRE